MKQFILFSGILCVAVAGPASQNKNVHELMTDKELMHIFTTKRHAVPEYEVVPIHLPRQHKRSDKSATKLHIKAFGQDIHLWLNPTEGILVGENTPVYIARSPKPSLRNAKTKIQKLDNPMANVGAMLEDREKQATLIVKKLENGKNSISGAIGDDGLVIKPLPEYINQYYNLRPRRSVNDMEYLQNNTMKNDELSYHVIYKLPRRNSNAHYAAMPKPNSYRPKNIARSKAKLKVPEVIYPEILIFIDYTTYKIHGEDMDTLLEYMLPFWNGVDLRYRSLQSPKVRFNIAGIVVAEDATALPFISKNMKSEDTLYIDESLGNFTEFFKDMQDVFPEDSYDITVTIAPYTMCTKEEDGSEDCDVLGLAFVGEACSEGRTSIVMDHGAFDGVETTVHEFGHLFGASHDGENDNSICADDAGHIMTPNSIQTHNLADWSACSLKQFDKFFRGLNGSNPSCLFDEPETTHALPRLLPGKVLTADQQCERLFGTSSCDIGLKEKDRCVRLACLVKGSVKKCMTELAPADGTVCAPEKICIHGKCVLQSEII